MEGLQQDVGVPKAATHQRRNGDTFEERRLPSRFQVVMRSNMQMAKLDSVDDITPYDKKDGDIKEWSPVDGAGIAAGGCNDKCCGFNAKRDVTWRLMGLWFIFWCKACVAFGMAVMGLGVYAYWIMQLHFEAVELRSYADLESSCAFYPSPSSTPPSWNVLMKLGNASTNIGRRPSVMEPPKGNIYWGVDVLDWKNEGLKSFNGRATIFGGIVGINETSIATEQVISMSTEIATHRKGATLYLTVYPTINVAEISNQTLWEFALLLRRVNVEIGVDIFLAWCSDMNGNWRPTYSFKPIETVRSHRILAIYIRYLTRKTAIVWNPAYAANYPFRQGIDVPVAGDGQLYLDVAAAVERNAENLWVLDTNGDGIVDEFDNGYSPFWPGAEWVDWVALGLWNPWPLQTGMLEAGEILIADAFSGFYRLYAVEAGVPMLVTGVASASSLETVVGSVNGGKESGIKTWWMALLSVVGVGGEELRNQSRLEVEYSLVKGIEWSNDAAGMMWGNKSVVKVWEQDVGSVSMGCGASGRGATLLSAGEVKVRCDGGVEVVCEVEA